MPPLQQLERVSTGFQRNDLIEYRNSIGDWLRATVLREGRVPGIWWIQVDKYPNEIPVCEDEIRSLEE